MNCKNPNCPRIHRHVIYDYVKIKQNYSNISDEKEGSIDKNEIHNDIKCENYSNNNNNSEIPKFIHSTYLYSNNICKF